MGKQTYEEVQLTVVKKAYILHIAKYKQKRVKFTFIFPVHQNIQPYNN